MASDLSSGCTEAIGVLDEKEEGEISLEDVSSSEEGHINYGYGFRAPQCPHCLSTQHCTAWCTAPSKSYHSRSQNKRDPVYGKENHQRVKEAACAGAKHMLSTLQEKNDDLVSISSESDMEIVGLADNSKQIVIRSAKPKAKKKKKRHTSMLTVDDLVSATSTDLPVTKECVTALKHNNVMTKNNISIRSHHRDVSPIRENGRSKMSQRSPPRRRRSPIKPRFVARPFERSQSPIIRTRSPLMRRSPKSLKSPKRSGVKPTARRISQMEVPSPSHNYVETHKLLKKVRKLGSMGSQSLEASLHKNREHASSLKEKLSTMMKGMSDNNGNVTHYSKEKTNVLKKDVNDADDEEDLALLRQKALETKQKKLSKRSDQPKLETTRKANINDDQDEEDLELRMIALQSAIMKKHKNRMQKGAKSDKHKKLNNSRSESPFNQSFFDSMLIPSEELLKIASPPSTPLLESENNHTEDMELDTDVEREKEKLPYSPTDKITTHIPMDTELLGIQPSDVSFISLNETNNSPAFSTLSPKEDQKVWEEKIIENRSYLPNVIYCTPSQVPLNETLNANVQYSPSDPTETPNTHTARKHNSQITTDYSESCNILQDNNAHTADVNSNEEMPYSPTDTPVYDVELSHTLVQTGLITTSNSSVVSIESSINSYMQRNTEQGNNMPSSQEAQICKAKHLHKDDESNKMEPFLMDTMSDSVATSLTVSASPTSSMITIDDLPENDSDACPPGSFKVTQSTEYIPDNLPNNARERVSEPLYMKGVPDITKDVNKIPTLINKTLLPAPILKSNKQLQQALPAKKQKVYRKPTFKCVEMQPVDINKEDNSEAHTFFKPMKLIPFAQKTHPITASNAFSYLLEAPPSSETFVNTCSTPIEHKNDQNKIPVQESMSERIRNLNETCDTLQKQKKVNKKGMKRKNSNIIQLAPKKPNACTNEDNTDTVNPEESTLNKTSKDNNKMAEECKQNKEKIDSRDVRDNSINNITDSTVQNNPNRDTAFSTNVRAKETNDTSSTKITEQLQSVESRRQSLDEDVEALRAILLASLPKRTKSTESNVANIVSTKTASTTIISNNHTDTADNQNIGLPLEQHSNKNILECNKVTGKVNETVKKGDLPTSTVGVTNPLISERKRSVPIANKGPQKKYVKRVSIPASTKVVNNAKKYQNAIIQKRLNLQKAAVQFNNKKMIDSKTISKVLPIENKWPSNTKSSLVSDTSRIVISLQSDTESDSESEQRKNKVSKTNSSEIEKQGGQNVTTDFEKNLEQFLRDARKKQETVAAARPTSLPQTQKKSPVPATQVKKGTSCNLHTPLAVRHLPASQQEEYRRLKQQIIEREKMKLHEKLKATSMSLKSTPSTSPKKESQYSKTNLNMPLKSPNIVSQQLNKENTAKHLNLSKSISNVNRQETSNPLQRLSTPVKNLNVQVTNDNTPSHNTATSVHENIKPAQEISPNSKSSSGLKILTKDEVNLKYVQIQVKHDERMVTISDKMAVNGKTGVNQDEKISRSKDIVKKNVCSQNVNESVQEEEKESVNSNSQANSNEEIDSDASTIILLDENQRNRKESLDTTQSTIPLSQYEGESNISTISSTENVDNNNSRLAVSSSQSKGNLEDNWEAIKKDIRTEVHALNKLTQTQQKQHLIDTEHTLVTKRYTILDELAEMSGNLRQWHMERDLQMNLATEVKKLREQLRIAEERLKSQRTRINSIGPKVVAAHERINTGRRECFKLSKICSVLGSQVVGKEYKVPEAGAQLLDTKLKEVANHTRQLSRKRVPSVDIPEMYTLSPETTSCSPFIDVASLEESLPLDKDNTDKNDMSVLSENECSMLSNEHERTVLFESNSGNTIDLTEQRESVTPNILNVRDNDQNKSQEDHDGAEQRKPAEDDNVPARSIPEENNGAVEESQGEEDNNMLERSKHKESNSEMEQCKPEEETNRQESERTDQHSNTLNTTPQSSSISIVPDTSSTKKHTTSTTGHQAKSILLPYQSILTHLKQRNTNPNGILCPYELMGTCKDGDCQFIHHSESQAK